MVFEIYRDVGTRALKGVNALAKKLELVLFSYAEPLPNSI